MPPILRDQYQRKRLNKVPDSMDQTVRLPTIKDATDRRRVGFPNDDLVPTVSFLPSVDQRRRDSEWCPAETLCNLEKKLNSLAINQEVLSQKLLRMPLGELSGNLPLLQEAKDTRQRTDGQHQMHMEALMERVMRTELRLAEVERGVLSTAKNLSTGHEDVGRLKKGFEEQMEDLRSLVMLERDKNRHLREEVEILSQKSEQSNGHLKELQLAVENKTKLTENKLKMFEKSLRDDSGVGLLVKTELKPVIDSLNGQISGIGEEVAVLTVG